MPRKHKTIDERFEEFFNSLKGLPISCMDDLEVGMIIKVVGNRNNNNYKIGKCYKVSVLRSETDDTFVAEDLDSGIRGNNLNIKDAIIIPKTMEDLDKIKQYHQEFLNRHKEGVELIEDKKDFMQRYGLEEFDEEKYEICTLLEIAEDEDTSRDKRVKAIKKLLDNR